MATYFLNNLCYESDGRVTRQAASDRRVARFASGRALGMNDKLDSPYTAHAGIPLIAHGLSVKLSSCSN